MLPPARQKAPRETAARTLFRFFISNLLFVKFTGRGFTPLLSSSGAKTENPGK